MRSIIKWGKRVLGLLLMGLFFMIFYFNKEVDIAHFNYIFGQYDQLNLMVLMTIIFTFGAITAFIVMLLANTQKILNYIKLKNEVKRLTHELEDERREHSVLQ